MDTSTTGFPMTSLGEETWGSSLVGSGDVVGDSWLAGYDILFDVLGLSLAGMLFGVTASSGAGSEYTKVVWCVRKHG